MDFNTKNNIKNVNWLTVKDISASGDISGGNVVFLNGVFTDVSCANLIIGSSIDMNNNYILNSKFSDIAIQNISYASGGILTSYYNDSGTQKESVKIKV